MPGLLDNFASNPWLGIGAGLLSAAGPSTDPRQIGLGPGLMAGLGNMNAMQQAQAQQQLQQLKVQQLKAQMAQAAQEQEQAKLDQERKARAIAALLENVPPEQRGLLGAVFNIDPGKAMGILEKMAIPEPPDLTTLQKEYQADVKSGAFTGTLLEYAAERERRKAEAVQPLLLERAREGRSRVDVRVGGQGYKWQTKPGEIAADLAYARTLPPGPERDSLIGSLTRLQGAQGMGAEARGRQQKIEAVEKIATEFNKIADANPDDVGPIAGTISGIKTDAGVIGRAARAASPTTEAQAALSALHNQMLTQLGTALSGAAIPEREWPRYEAQIPLMTDDKNMRAQKAKMLKQLIGILHDIQEGRAAKEDAAALLGADPGLEGATITIPGS